jgi:hypothetical protein
MSGLPYGRTLADIQQAAGKAARYTYLDSVSYADRYDEAWSGIVELLYTSTRPPSDWELLRAGQRALSDMVRQWTRHRGYDDRAEMPSRRPSFERFWCSPAVSSPEDGIVERVALHQILPLLQPRSRQALFALAAAGQPEVAAEHMGLDKKIFLNQVGAARRQFRRWWHEGEVPSEMWRRGYRSDDSEAIADGPERCRRGHVRSPANVYVARSGLRQCRRCSAERRRSARSTRGQRRAVPDPPSRES